MNISSYLEKINIAVVIPCYKVERHIQTVIDNIPHFINHIIVVDDCCPNKSGQLVIDNNKDNERVIVVFNSENKGVGGAVKHGYTKALELGCDIVIKMDGDNQMNPDYLIDLITPLILENYDYTKGNRFKDFKALKTMPLVRLVGNSGLSFLLKVASGYWDIMDPTNGYTAIRTSAIKDLNLEKIENRYFFESDMLINLNIENKRVKDVSIPALYSDEESSLNIKKVLMTFPQKIAKKFVKRIFLKYFLYDFNMVSIYTVLGFPLLFFGLTYGICHWIESAINNTVTPAGTVMLSALPIILAVQFILQAISLDIENNPNKRN